MSARQALDLIEACAHRDQQQIDAIWEQATHKPTAPLSEARQPDPDRSPIERFSIELDGVFARLRRGSLPMEAHEQEREGEVSREIKAGAVFWAQAGQERSEQVEGVFVDEPVTRSLRSVAQRTARGDVGRHVSALAVEQGLLGAKQVVVLGDGAPWLWRLAEEHFPEAVPIGDVYHATPHVWEVASAVFGRSSPEGITWAKHACEWLVHGHSETVIKAIAALPPVAPPPGQSKSVPEQAIGSFPSNAARMRSPAFRAQGMHIGSGMAQATGKTVVSTRAKRAGMHRTPQGLDALFPLRTAVRNGSYDAFWRERASALASGAPQLFPTPSVRCNRASAGARGQGSSGARTPMVTGRPAALPAALE
jgi:hypothetical protein